eukprot:scaffold119850_cov38-Attheya_sp.AAC.2
MDYSLPMLATNTTSDTLTRLDIPRFPPLPPPSLSLVCTMCGQCWMCGQCSPHNNADRCSYKSCRCRHVWWKASLYCEDWCRQIPCHVDHGNSSGWGMSHYHAPPCARIGSSVEAYFSQSSLWSNSILPPG